jgi:hypothetical protein
MSAELLKDGRKKLHWMSWQCFMFVFVFVSMEIEIAGEAFWENGFVID